MALRLEQHIVLTIPSTTFQRTGAAASNACAHRPRDHCGNEHDLVPIGLEAPEQGLGQRRE
jgi:hypothetical protein